MTQPTAHGEKGDETAALGFRPHHASSCHPEVACKYITQQAGGLLGAPQRVSSSGPLDGSNLAQRLETGLQFFVGPDRAGQRRLRHLTYR